MITCEDITLISYRTGDDERWVWFFTNNQLRATIRSVVKTANDPDLSFSPDDAKVVIGRLVKACRLNNGSKS